MPLNRCGSVKARFSVWFSRSSRSRKSILLRRQHVESAGIERGERCGALHHVQRCAALGAGFSGEDERAVGKFEERPGVILPGGLRPSVSHCRRPAIIRLQHEEELAVQREARCVLPMRDTSRTVRPLAASSGGTAVRNTNGLRRCTARRGCPITRARECFAVDLDIGKLRPSRADYAACEGSFGGPDRRRDVAGPVRRRDEASFEGGWREDKCRHRAWHGKNRLKRSLSHAMTAAQVRGDLRRENRARNIPPTACAEKTGRPARLRYRGDALRERARTGGPGAS